MKLLLILALIATLCASQATYPSAKQNLTDFLTGLYNGLGTTPPTSKSLQCFDETSSQYFFQWLQSAYNAELQLSAGNVSSYVSYMSKVSLAGYYVTKGFSCSTFDQDWKHFVKALNMPVTFGKTLQDVIEELQLYFTAIPGDFQEYLQEPLQSIDAGEYSKAGSLLSEKLLNTTQLIDLYTNGLQSWFNGIFLHLGLPTPVNITNCLSNSPLKAEPLYNFYYLLSQVITRANSRDTLTVRNLYLNSIGKEFLNLTAYETWGCVFDSPDAKLFEEKLGFSLDPYSIEFNEELANFVNSSDYNKGVYLGIIANLYPDWDLKGFLIDGISAGYLFRLVSEHARTISS